MRPCARRCRLPANIPIGGQADWHGVLKMAPEPARERSLRITSSLAGLELKLPEPLAKPADAPLPSSVELSGRRAAELQVRVALGSVLRGALILERARTDRSSRRAAVAFGIRRARLTATRRRSMSAARSRRSTSPAGSSSARPTKSAKPLTNYLRSAELEVAESTISACRFSTSRSISPSHDGGWRIVGRRTECGGHHLPPGRRESGRAVESRVPAPQFDRRRSPRDAAPTGGRRAGDPHGSAQHPGRSIFTRPSSTWDDGSSAMSAQRSRSWTTASASSN